MMKAIVVLLIVFFLLSLVGAIYLYNEGKALIREIYEKVKLKIQAFERSGYFLGAVHRSNENLVW